MRHWINKKWWAVFLPMVVLLAPTSHAATSIVRAVDMTVARGATNTVSIVLDAIGIENGVQLSLCFDTNYLKYVSTVRGTDGLGSSLFLVNTNQLTNGHLGLVLGLATGVPFDPGLRHVFEVSFRSVAGVSSALTTVNICDLPVGRELVDVDANTLDANYSSATVTILGTCTYSLGTNSAAFDASGGPATVAVTVNDSGCPWSVLNTNSWITITSSTNNTGSGTVAYTVSANSAAARTGVVLIAGQPFTVTQAAPSCSYSLSTTARNHGPGATTNTIILTTGNGCPWTLVNLNDWITFTTPSSGTGSTTNTYTVAANPNPIVRTGLVQIAGQTLTISQDPVVCSYSLSPKSRSHGPGAAANTFGVTTSAGCDWSATTTNSWILLQSGTNGPGAGTIGYSVETNPITLERIGAIMVGDQSFVITQKAASCTVALTSSSASFGANATNSTFDVTSAGGCSWTVSNTNTWISITSSTTGSSNSTIHYSVASNTTALARSGLVTVIGPSNTVNFTVQQASSIPCTFTLSPTSATHSGNAETGTVNVATGAGCSWTVTTTNSWISISSPASNTGSNAVTYTVSANPGTSSRTGLVVIAGQSFQVTQAGSPCTYSLSPKSRSHGSGIATNTIGVTTIAECNWTATTTNTWILLLSGTNGPGGGTVTYYVPPNPNALERIGAVMIADQSFVITQKAASCTVALTSSSASPGSSAASGSFDVTSAGGCSWTVSNSNSWITISSSTNGSGDSTVNYSVAANAGSARSGVVSVFGPSNTVSFTVNQAGFLCTYSLSPKSRSHGNGIATNTIGVTAAAACNWTATTTNTWILLLSGTNGPGGGTVTYYVPPNPNALERIGAVMIADQSFVITQKAASCTVALTPASASPGASAASGSFDVTSAGGCSWTVSNSNSWITISSSTNGSGDSTVNYSVAANTGSARSGVVTVVGPSNTVSFTVTQAVFTCSYALSTTFRSHGQGATTNTVTLTTSTGCAWTIVNTNSWITFESASSGSGTATNTYSVLANPSSVTRTGVVQIAGQTLTISQDPILCTYSLSPKSRSHGNGAAANTIGVTAAAACNWTATTTNTWILLQSGTNGPGNGTVNYSVPSNPNALERIGAVMIADQSFVITQKAASCTVALTSSSASLGVNATNSSFDVTSAGGCSWTVSNSNAWITITSSTNGSGNSTVNYSAAANTGVARSGVVTVVGASNTVNFTVNQAGPVCSYALSTTFRSHGQGATTNSVTLTTSNGCAWTIVNTNSWITFESASSGSGSATNTYSVLANPSPSYRTGVVQIAGQTLTISQDPFVCTYSLSPKSRSHGSGIATNTIGVTAAAVCNWTATTTNTWILLQSGTNGPGNGTVTYAVPSNPNALERIGAVMIADQSFVITQKAASCTVALTSSSASLGVNATNSSFDVTSAGGCSWTVSNSNAWITITSSTNGGGNSTVNYSAAANTGIARSGVVTIVGASNAVNFTVSQAGAVCSYDLSPTSRSHGPGAATNTVTLTTDNGCAWTIVNTNDWVLFSDTGGTGSNTLTYAVTANPAMMERIGNVMIADQFLTLTQRAAPCTFDLSTTSRTHGFSAISNSVTLTTLIGCTWTIVNTNGWITFTSPTNGSGSATNSYTVDANPDTFSRTGVLMIADQLLTLRQLAAPCTYVFTPSNATHSISAGTGLVSIATSANCPWAVTNTNNWITITTGTTGTGNGSFGYAVSSNPSPIPRSGIVQISGEEFLISQAGVPCDLAIAPLGRAHGAGAESNSISVTTGNNCPWTVVETNNWITITSGNTGSGNGSVSYAVDANPTILPRSGTIVIAGQVFTVTQQGAACTYKLSPTSRTHGAGAATGSVAVTVLAGCDWSVATADSWITITSGFTGSGNGNFAYAVAANSNLVARIGLVTVADQSLIITQQAAVCTFSLSTTNRTHGNGTVTGSVSVTTLAGCSWTALSTNSWITFVTGTNFTGSNTVTYMVETNQSYFWRTGNLVIAEHVVTLNQRPTPCTYLLSPSNALHGAGDEIGFVTITAAGACPWAVENTNSWITLMPDFSGTGNGSFSYEVAANPLATSRTGVVLVADQILTVAQSGAPCDYLLSASSRAHTSGAATGTVSVTVLTGCDWTVANTNTWITIAPVTGGSGNGIVTYTLDANATVFPRTGVVTIASQSFTVSQSGATCSYTLAPGSRTHTAGMETGTVSVAAMTGCPWTAGTTDSWISILAGASGSGTGSVTYAVATNPAAIMRTGSLSIGGQTFTVNQTAAGCSFALSVSNHTHGAGIETGSVAVITLAGCAWTATNTNTWITLTSGASGSGGGSVVYTVASNATAVARSGVVTIAGIVFTVGQDGAPCTFAIAPTSRSYGSGPTNGTVAVTAMTGCSWTTINTNAWITLTSGTSGSGTGTVAFTVASNATAIARSGAVTIAGQPFTVSQSGAACSYTINPTNLAYGANATNSTVAVTAILGCDWTVSNTNTWITINSGTNGTGAGSVNLSASANPTAFARTGVVVIATRPLTITQTGAACSYALTLSNRTHGAGIETGSVDVTTITGCAWTTSNTNSWITLTSGTNGSGNGTLVYAVASNGTAIARSGVITVAGQSFTVNQSGAACSFVIAPTSRSYSFVATNGSVNVTSLVGCAWTALTTNSWILITSGASGSGNGSVSYTVSSNATSLSRTGGLTIGGQDFTVTQSGAPCNYSISPTNRSYAANSTNGTVAVSALDAGCPWGTVNTNSWITLTGNTNGSGAGTVDFSVAANPTALARTGVLMIASQPLTVTQSGATCTYSLTLNSQNHGAGVESGSVGVISITGCPWTVSNTNTWITITSNTNGSGNGTVSYSVASNTTALSRSGPMTIAGRSFTVNQDGAPCSYTLNPTSRTHTSGAETSSVSVVTLTGCPWTANNTNSWISILSGGSGSGNGAVTYSVLPNPSSSSRSGLLEINGQLFTVTQLGAPCTNSISPASWVHHVTAETGMVSVITAIGCNWTANNTNPWVTITAGASGTGNGTVTYSVAANTGVGERAGVMTIAGQPFAISQLSTGCTYKISPTSRFHGSGTASNTVSVTASNGCSWSVINTNTWVTILSNATGSGSATIGYSVSSNRSPVQRTGVLNIGGEYLALTQWGTNCGLALTPSSRAHGFASETGLVTVTTSTSNCTWSATTTNSWITINTGTSGTGSGTLGYTVAANTTSGARTGVITVSGEIFTVTQTGQPCTYAIAPASRAHGSGSESGSVSVTAVSGCAWSTANTNSWITITSGATGTGDGTVNYTIDANPAGLSRSGVVTLAGQPFTVTQSGAPCVFSISPTNQNMTGSGTGLVTVTTISGCSWTADNTNSWILITSAADGTGSGSIAYSVSANVSAIARTGLVTIAGRTLTVTQPGLPCTFSILPSNREHGGTAETGLVAVTSITGCAWTASNTNSWITLVGGTNGTGSGSIGYALAANASTITRTGIVVIAGQAFTVTQLGAGCSYSLVPTSRSHGSSADSGTVGVAATSGCAWTVSNTNSWIGITSGATGTGSGTVGYSIEANPATTPRSGTLTVGGQSFTVTQAGLFCSYTLSPAGRAHSAGAEAGTVDVTTTAGCAWTVVNTNAWISYAGPSGSGSGIVTYSMTANPGLPRSGNLVIGGQIFAVSQGTGLRLLRVIDMNVALGQTNKLLVVLDSAGDENGLGFSLCYNTNVLTYVKAVRGREATNASATLNVNTGSTNRGRLGLAMALNADQVFPAGSNTVVEVSFRAAPGTNAVTTSVSLCDLPIGREVVDVLANPVDTSYADGIVSVIGNCTYALAAGSAAFNETGGNGSVGVIAGTGCAWTVANSNSWIAITSGAGGTGNGTVSFTVAPNGGTSSRTGLVVIAGQNFTVSQSGTPCSYVIVPTEQAHGAGAETGAINLTTVGACAWTATAGTNWITITSSTSGTGSATINYSVSANPSSVGRTGTVLVAGQTFTVRQTGVPCTYAINPSSRAHGSATETGSITVTTAAGCSWVVVNGNSWITITSGAAGNGSGSVGYSVAFNPSLGGRTGVVSVAGQTFTVTQPGNPCAVTLSPTNAALLNNGGTGLVSIAAAGGCAWTVGNTNTWITITSATNGTGNGSFGYSVGPNPSGAPRTGGINVAGQFFIVDQAGATCVFAIAPSERAHGFGSEGGLVSVATFSGCSWTVINTNSWITIDSPITNVIGSGSVSYTVNANPAGLGRTGTVVIAGMPLTVSQAGAPCSYAIVPASRSHGFGVESASVTLNSLGGCPWTVFNSNSWITVTSPTNGAGPTTVNYTVNSNPAGLSRTGTISIGGQPFTVFQAAAPCTYSLSTSNRVHGNGATNNTVTMTTPVGCTWSVVNSNPWITIQSALNNAGPGTVSYSVDENTTAFGRTGTVSIAGLTLTLAQLGAPCTYAISPTNRTHGYAATNNTVDVTSVTGCPWTISNTNNWITFLSGTNGTGSVSITYAVTDNPAAFARTGLVTIAGQTLTLAQVGAPCVYVLTPDAASHPSDGQAGLFSVGAIPGCTWTVSNTNSWITMASATNGTGTGTVAYLVATNTSSAERVGVLNIADQIFTVTQAGMACNFALSPTNGSLTSGNVTGLVSVITTPTCPWVIINTNTWIAIKSPATASGTGSGLVRYTAAANPNPSVRIGTLIIGGVPFTVSQLGSPCNYSLSPTNRLHGSGIETNVISVLTVNECSWTASSTNPWITVLSGTNGSGNGLVTYSIGANPGSIDRTGTVAVAGMIFPVTQLGSACLYSLAASNTSYGPLGSTGSVSVTATPGCVWSVSNTNTWITITSGASGTNNGLVNYSVAANFSPVLRSGSLRIGGQSIFLSQTGIVCSFAITPTSGLHGPAPETGQLSVVTSNLCPWTVNNTNSWITILSPTNSIGNTNVSYSLALNLSAAARTGQFTVAGQTYTVTQSGIVCTFAISPTNGSYSAATQTGQVSVVTSNICPWTVDNTNAWITILSPTNISGNSTVFYSVATNTSVLPRTGQFIIAGQTYTVTQAGFICTFALNPTARAHPFNAVTGLVTVTTGNGCAWTLANTNSWITFLGSTNRTSSGFVSYVAAINSGFTVRTGVLSIAGQPFVVTQFGVPFLGATNKTLPCGTPWTFDPPVPTGTCSDTNYTLTILSTVTNVVCGSAFNVVRRWDALDACSNHVTLTQTVSVVATAPPTITCAGLRTLECGTAWTFDTPVATEGCGGTNVTLVILDTVTNAGSCGGTFTATRTWQAIDGCTNSSMCSQTVSVIDTTPPALLCQPNRTIPCGTAWSFDVPTVTDNCDGAAVTSHIVSTVTNAAGLCSGTLVATRSWEAVDACGNRSTCSQTISVIDVTPPSLACAANKTVECGVVWTFDMPVAIDSCVGTNVTLRIMDTITNMMGTCGNAFIATRSWEALDGCSNRSTCSQSVTVVDTTPPTVACAATKTAESGTAWSFDPPTMTDSCMATGLTLVVVSTVTNTTGSCGNTFAVTRTWETLDGCSNRSARCSQLVLVIDTTPPVLTCAADKLVTCGGAWTFSTPTATDLGDGTNVVITVVSTVTNTAGSCGSTFTATRTWQATDRCDNTSTCSQTVRLIDATPPVLTCALNKTVPCGTAWTFDAPTATDSCSGTNVTVQITSTVTNTSGLCGGTFTATRTWQATDSCTNSSTCSQTVTIIDATPPSLACAANKSVECGLPWNFDLPVATDSCVGTNVTIRIVSTVTNTSGACGNMFTATRTWEALDTCSNRTTCAQTITMMDTTPPTLVCPATKTVEFGFAWSFDAPTITDSCSATGLTLVVVSTVTNTAGSCGSNYTATRTWEALDGCSNRSASCSQLVRVIDSTQPVLSCPADKLVPCGNAWTFDAPTATDLADGTNTVITVVSTVTNNAGSCGGTFTATRTWRATDRCDNTSTCSQTVRLIDATPPALTCGLNKTVPCGTPWTFDAPTATDSCSGTNVTVQITSTVTNTSGLCGGTFTATRTWQATDSCTNSSTCSQTVTIIDATPPSLACAANKSVECGLPWNFDLPVATDSCVGTNVTLRIVSTVTNASGACGNSFTATRTWEALDSCSNRTTCAQTVAVVDTTPPTLVCAATKTAEFGAAWSFTTPTMADSCATGLTLVVVSTVTNAAGSCGNTFTVTRTWEALDGCSNRSSSCSQLVRIIDTTPPVLTCAADKLFTCGNAWNFDAPTATDSADGTNVILTVVSTVTNTAGSCGGTFTATRTWQATDRCDNTSTCSQTVRLIDATPPVLTCALNKTVPCGTAWTFDAPAATDSCSGTNVTLQVVSTVTNTAGLCGGTFTATRTWQATDGCTNSATCSQTVTIIDTTAPSLICAANKSVECGLPWNFDLPVATDSCVGTNVTLRIVSTVTNASGACGNAFTATRTWEALDSCSNRTTCAQTVAVVDTTPPTLVCPATRIVELGSAWSFDTPIVTDSCGAGGLTLMVVSTVTNTAGSCGNTYTVTRTWEALDGCSNRSASCSQLVRLIDATPPLLICPADKLVTCGNAWTFDAPTATDSADGTNVVILVGSTVTNNAGSCGGTFTATRTWQATDRCDNTSTCSQTVRLIDATPPALTCALNKTVPCGTPWTFDAPTATDSCSGTNVTLQVVSTVTNTAGLCGGTFTATRTWRATDGCTNSSTCSQTVTIIDTTAPSLTCAANKSVECGVAWNFDLPVATDSCVGTNVTLRIVGTVTNAAGACGNTFTTTRTWEALDGCSNRTTCAQTVAVVDTTPPTLVCPATKTVELGSAWSFNTPTAVDSCSLAGVTFTVISTVTNAGTCGNTYTATRTWEVTDACSNRSATCSQLVRVIDSTPPVLTCPADKLVVCGGAWTFDSPTATDLANSTNVTIILVSTITNGTCASGFSATRIWQAIDSCSNRSATCSQSVSAMNHATIAGTVSYQPTNSSPQGPTAKRLSPVSIIVTGGTNLTTQTAADGTYSVDVGVGNAYTVTPQVTNSNPSVNGVSTLDISLIRRHILNIASLDTPYKLLAGDVNGSRSVTTLDISLLRRVILGVTNNFPMGLWRFVPSDYVFPDPLNPWDAPTNRTYTNLVVPLTNQDFMGIKLGDVNNSWMPPVSFTGFAPASFPQSANLAFAPEVFFAVSRHTNQPGDTVVAQVTASGFRDVTSAQWTLAWDPTVLRYKSTGKYGLKGLASGNFGTSLIDSGHLTFSWDDPDALGVTTADGSTVFSANFEVIGIGGSVSPLVLSGSATETEVSVNFSEANLRAASGLVTVVGPTGDLPPQPQLATVVYTNGVFGVPQQTVPGRRYTLEYTDSLPATHWTPLPPVIGDGSVLILSDPGAATTRQRFYRLRIE